VCREKMPTNADDDKSQATNHSAQLIMSGQLRQRSTGDLLIDENSSLVANGFVVRADPPPPVVIDFQQDDPSEMTYGRRIALSLMNQKWYNPSAVDDNEFYSAHDESSRGESYHDETFSDAAMDPAPTDTRNTSGPDLFAQTKTTKADLKKGWAYFEHVVLDRYIVEKKPDAPKKNTCMRIIRKFQKGNKKLERAEPGEKDVVTRLYSPIFTPHKQLGDFGLGIGLYFSTLRAITLITFVLGLVSAYNFNYFASDAYLPSEFRDNGRGAMFDKFIHGSAVCTNTRK